MFSKPFFPIVSLDFSLIVHRNPDSAEKRNRPGSCLVDIDGHQNENDKAFYRPLLAGSRSYFNFYINEEDQGQGKQKQDDNRNSTKDKRGRGISSSGMDEMEDIEEAGGHQPLNGLIDESKTDRECPFLSHFNIPNFVNLDHSSTLGEDDLLYEPSAVLERQSQAHNAHCGSH